MSEWMSGRDPFAVRAGRRLTDTSAAADGLTDGLTA